ncbi:MAG TPA: PAS domain S-box protein [Vicinamibacterales bacterium]|nr:PAS domain S-box protein [Vicinamibacterales bacterium]
MTADAPMCVLLVEDDASYAALIAAELQGAAIDLHQAGSLAAAASEIPRRSFDAILLDLGLPDSSGIDTVRRMHEAAGAVPIVVLTANDDETLSVLSMQRGAQDHLLKSDADASALVRSLRYARERGAFRQSLLESEMRFRALVENSYDAITLLDEHGRVTYDSRSIERVMGYTPEERFGQDLGTSLHEDDVPQIAERFAYCLGHPDEILHADYRFRHKDGSWRWGEAVGVNRLADPAVRAIVVNHRDVTDRKTVETALRHSEEQLRQAQKMEAIGRLAGGVAHDFNNVLTAIYGYTDLLLDQFSLDDPRRADLQEIRRAAERAASLTRQLLAFSRKQIMQPRRLDLNQVIATIRTLLQRLVGEDLVLAIRTDPELVAVHADPGQMEQVLMNLAANARDAMPEGGQLTIATRNERVAELSAARPGLSPGLYAVIEITDTGSGMPAVVQAHVFEPFYTTKELGKGTGLGLATVYGIVKQTGGGIYLESDEGQGTTFAVYLPQAPE